MVRVLVELLSNEGGEVLGVVCGVMDCVGVVMVLVVYVKVVEVWKSCDVVFVLKFILIVEDFWW